MSYWRDHLTNSLKAPVAQDHLYPFPVGGGEPNILFDIGGGKPNDNFISAAARPMAIFRNVGETFSHTDTWSNL